MLVTRGTLKKGAWLVAGTAGARVRSLADENGRPLSSVGPGEPAEVTGWRAELPGPGELVLELPSESRLREVLAHRLEEEMKELAEETAVSPLPSPFGLGE